MEKYNLPTLDVLFPLATHPQAVHKRRLLMLKILAIATAMSGIPSVNGLLALLIHASSKEKITF